MCDWALLFFLLSLNLPFALVVFQSFTVAAASMGSKSMLLPTFNPGPTNTVADRDSKQRSFRWFSDPASEANAWSIALSLSSSALKRADNRDWKAASNVLPVFSKRSKDNLMFPSQFFQYFDPSEWIFFFEVNSCLKAGVLCVISFADPAVVDISDNAIRLGCVTFFFLFFPVSRPTTQPTKHRITSLLLFFFINLHFFERRLELKGPDTETCHHWIGPITVQILIQ